MGVIYKLRDEVVQYIIVQRQNNPLASCRELAESASAQFGVHLSKSSVHDVLKASGITTPRGRKPKDKFEIPQEKKKQIQTSLAKVNLLPSGHAQELGPQTGHAQELGPLAGHAQELAILEDVKPVEVVLPPEGLPSEVILLPDETTKPADAMEISPEYDGAGNIFLKAARWDLGIYAEGELKSTDREYYLTYAKGVRLALENNKEIFIDLPLPLERCIREVADGLIANSKPFIAERISDEPLFRACMELKNGLKINEISIMDCRDHVIVSFYNIVDVDREFYVRNRYFVECSECNALERLKLTLFSQMLNNNEVIDNIIKLKGFDKYNDGKCVVTLLIESGYEFIDQLETAVKRLNAMYLYDEKNRLVCVEILLA